MSDRSLPGVHETPEQARRRGWIGFAIGTAILLGVAGCMAAVSTRSGGYDMNNPAEAISQCEARIEKLLKSPSTASFDSEATGSGEWHVTGTVDSENGFGAMVRSMYSCTVVMDNDAGTATTTVDYLE